MAKLNYVEGDYKEALNIYARVGLDDLPLTAVPPYRLRMLAEAFATKGEASSGLRGFSPVSPVSPVPMEAQQHLGLTLCIRTHVFMSCLSVPAEGVERERHLSF